MNPRSIHHLPLKKIYHFPPQTYTNPSAKRPNFPQPMFSMERKWISSNIAHELAPNCPRCASPNTKFCYYNNYSLLQPRYFCKGCRRYWTNGGSLRNVPFGGGCRKNRRSAKQRGSSSHRPSYSLWTSGNTESDSSCDGNSTGKSGNSNSGSSFPSGGLTDSILPDDDQLQHEEINGGGIDVAAVFARFLSEDSSSRDHFFCPNLVDVSNSRCPDDQINDLSKEYNNPAASLTEYDQPLEALEMVNGNNIDDWMVQVDSNCLWSKADDLSHLDFTWQSPGEQLQDFGLYSAGVGHQLELPAEHLRDIGNWSCYDPVAIEPSTDIFS